MLDARQLTGRSADHVQHVEALCCTIHPLLIDPLTRLREAAAADGIDLAVASSFRDFERQRRIWNEKFTGQRPTRDRTGGLIDILELSPPERIETILCWSALPGASRHHWGSDLDVYDRAALPSGYTLQLTTAEYSADGPFAKLASWLREHAASHGFFRPYEIDRGGILPEPWHLSYAPLAQACSERLTPAVLEEALVSSEIEGIADILANLPSLHRRYCLVNSAITGV